MVHKRYYQCKRPEKVGRIITQKLETELQSTQYVPFCLLVNFHLFFLSFFPLQAIACMGMQSSFVSAVSLPPPPPSEFP